jgi:hypothetical protein
VFKDLKGHRARKAYRVY